MGEFKFNTIEEAIEDIKNGKMIIVVDDEDRENEGDLVIAAEKVTPHKGSHRSKHQTFRSCKTGAHIPAKSQKRRCPQEGGTHGSSGGSCKTGRFISCRGYMRDNERGRHHGEGAPAYGIC